MIDILNKSHQEMKWTNHPRIFFEVAVVKICQTSHQSAADLPEVDMLMKKIQQLEQEVERLKTTGIKAAAESPKKKRRVCQRVGSPLQSARRQNS